MVKMVWIKIKKHRTQFNGIELFGLIITTRKQLENARIKIDIEKGE